MEWLLQNNMIAYIVTAFLGAFGSKFFFSRKMDIISQAMIEITQLLTLLVESLKPDADGKVRITTEEAEQLRKEIMDILKLFRPGK